MHFVFSLPCQCLSGSGWSRSQEGEELQGTAERRGYRGRGGTRQPASEITFWLQNPATLPGVLQQPHVSLTATGLSHPPGPSGALTCGCHHGPQPASGRRARHYAQTAALPLATATRQASEVGLGRWPPALGSGEAVRRRGEEGGLTPRLQGLAVGSGARGCEGEGNASPPAWGLSVGCDSLWWFSDLFSCKTSSPSCGEVYLCG